MKARHRRFILIAIMSLSSLAVSAAAIAFLYHTSFKEQRERLLDTVRGQAMLIEAVARYDTVRHNAGSKSSALADTLIQIGNANRDYEKGGRKAEFVLGKKNGGYIEFLLKPRHDVLGSLDRVLLDSPLAQPMRQALAGKSGTMVGRDYRGRRVLAAYQPLADLGWGIVAKIDLDDIRAPFVRASLLALLFTALVVLVGAALFVKLTNPVIRRLRELNTNLERRVEERTAELASANERLASEIEHRIGFEKELQDTNVVLQAVVNAIPDPLVLLSWQMKVRMLNEAARKYYGYTGDQGFAECTCHEMLRESDAPCEGCEIAATVQAGQSVRLERKGFMNPERLEQVFVYPVEISARRSTEYLLRISDITEQRNLEKQVIQNEKMAQLGLMVTSIAHEINNPNASISFNIPILRDCFRELIPITDAYAEGRENLELCRMPYAEFREDIFRNLDNVEQSSRRITNFVSNLKDVISSRERMKEEWVRVAAVAEKAVSSCDIQSGDNCVPIRVRLPQDDPRIWTDPNALEQILTNLLLNARQACEYSDAPIELDIEVNDRWSDHTIVTVTDRGEGMDPETSKHIFDPFFTARSHGRGTGLGLYVCRNLVDSLRGRIEVTSEPGRGSTFKVILPDRERRRSERI